MSLLRYCFTYVREVVQIFRVWDDRNNKIVFYIRKMVLMYCFTQCSW